MYIENGIVYEEGKHITRAYCNEYIAYNGAYYKFCMGECTLEGCEGQYHTFIESEDGIAYNIENADLLTVEEYKASIASNVPLTQEEQNAINIQSNYELLLTIGGFWNE